MSRLGAMTVVVVAVSLLSSLSACGDDAAEQPRPDAGPDASGDAGPDGPPDGPVLSELEKFGLDLTTAVCAATIRCDVFAWFKSQEECVTHYDRYFDGKQTKYLRSVGEAIERQISSFHRESVTRCLAELTAGACPVSLESPACQAMLTGTVAAGATCFSHEECAAPGSTCVDLDVELACRAGTCSSTAALGEACSELVPCAPGAHCVDEAGGAVCEPGDAGARCNNHVDCDGELSCQMGACVADRAIGQSCRTDAECAPGSLCVGDLNSPIGAGVCDKASAVGDACDDYCYGTHYCDVRQIGQNGTCEELPGRGAPCFRSLGRCAGIELLCSERDMCEPLPALGEDCTTTCQAGRFCSSELDDSDEGSCVALGATGAACMRDGNCASYDCGADSKCQDWSACRGDLPAR